MHLVKKYISSSKYNNFHTEGNKIFIQIMEISPLIFQESFTYFSQ